MAPKPGKCKPWGQANFWRPFIKLFTWDNLFASLWGLVTSTPSPLILATLFKKRVILAKMSDKDKSHTLNLWLWRDRAGWALVTVIHIICWFVLSQFVRYYPWALVESWFLATLSSAFHRFFSAPTIRVTWMLIILLISKVTGIFDLVLALSPQLTIFPRSVPLPILMGLESSPNDEREDAEEDLEEGEAVAQQVMD